MRRSVCVKWYEEILKEVFTGREGKKYKNPCIAFVSKAKAGVFDSLSDDEYDILYAEAKEISAFWDSECYRKSSEILKDSLKELRLPEDTFLALAEILVKHYEKTFGPFTPENAFLDVYADSDIEMHFFENRFFEDYAEENTSQKKPVSSKHKNFMPENEKLTVDSIKNPKQIYKYLSAGIHGQQEAVKAASMLLYNHIHGRKRNLLFAGPTGCGKTEIWRVLKQIYPHIQIVDSTIITQQGWSGNFKIKDIFAGMEQEEIEKSIIVFDEFDKFCEPKYSSHGNNVGADNQNELLKMIEGNQMTFPDKNGNLTLEFDSSKISFVFCGSFERLMETKTEKESSRSLGFGSNIEKPDVHAQYQKEITPKDLVTYAGIRQEIAGRINQIVQLYPMTAEDYNMILHDQKISPLHQLERQYEVRLYLDEQTSQRLVTEAAESHMGVRYLRSKIQQLLDDQIFQDCEQTEYQLGA